jgi:hypothetical protein
MRSAFKQAVYGIRGAPRATQGASQPCANDSGYFRDEPSPGMPATRILPPEIRNFDH